jgi:NitT/TauT family transport system permease protein
MSQNNSQTIALRTIKPFRRLPVFDLGTVLSVAVAALLLGSWEYSVHAGFIPAYLLPAPSKVVMQLYTDLLQESVRVDIYYTLGEILLGFALATVIGIVCGAAIALVPLIDKILSPYITCLQTIPKPAIAPLLIIWFGFGISSKVVIVALIAFYPIVVNAVVGFRDSDPRQILLMRVMKASKWQIFRMVQLPNALPYLMAGLQIAMVFSVIGAIVGEFLGASRGLGALIIQRQASMDVAGVFSVLVVLSSVGIILSMVIKACSKKLVFWGPAEEIRGV